MTSMQRAIIISLTLWGLTSTLGWFGATATLNHAQIDARIAAPAPQPVIANCYSYNDKAGNWDRLRNPADFVPPGQWATAP